MAVFTIIMFSAVAIQELSIFIQTSSAIGNMPHFSSPRGIIYFFLGDGGVFGIVAFSF